MMKDQTVIKLDINGPNAGELPEWEEIPEEELDSAAPVQRGHEYLNLHEGRLTAGLWDCTPYVTKLDCWSVHEYIYMLEGSVTLIDESGSEQTFVAGDHFVIPKGMLCVWKQTEKVRKFYVIFSGPAQEATIKDTALRATKIGPHMQLTAMAGLDAVGFENGVPNMNIATPYSHSQFDAGVWDCDQMRRVPDVINRTELMHIIEGKGSVINADDIEFKFEAGDTFIVPVGMGYQWRSDHYVKKIFCSFTPPG